MDSENTKIDIRNLSPDALAKLFVEQGEKAFRAKQVHEWLWNKSAHTFDEMTNLSKEIRDWMKERFTINSITLSEAQKSKDGTVKAAFKLHDGNVVEGVLIPTSKRMTACVSSQVGCSLTCKFCATGKMERVRNLNPDEIYDQVVAIRDLAMEHHKMPLSNIVMMGMGEPLLNYKNVMEGIAKITSDKGLGMSAKRITLSTAGIAKMIKKLADDNVKFNLALSLHAANDEKRNKIMPINEQNSLESLSEALLYFTKKTKGELTYEYIIFRDFNDESEDAYDLVEFCRKVPAKVNIIEYNPIDGGEFKQADSTKVDAFVKILERHKIVANVRRSRGKDIDAACGQLANKNKLAKFS